MCEVLRGNVIRSVVTSKSIHLLSGEVCFVSARVCKAKDRKTIIVLPETTQIKGFSVSSGLYLINENKIQIEVRNLTNT